MKTIDVFTELLLVALIGGGFLIARRLFERRNMMDPPMEMLWRSEYGSKDDYGRSVPPHRSYDGPGYPQQMGTSPWAAGGLGALGSGLLGYQLGQMAEEHDQLHLTRSQKHFIGQTPAQILE